MDTQLIISALQIKTVGMISALSKCVGDMVLNWKNSTHNQCLTMYQSGCASTQIFLCNLISEQES